MLSVAANHADKQQQQGGTGGGKAAVMYERTKVAALEAALEKSETDAKRKVGELETRLRDYHDAEHERISRGSPLDDGVDLQALVKAAIKGGKKSKQAAAATAGGAAAAARAGKVPKKAAGKKGKGKGAKDAVEPKDPQLEALSALASRLGQENTRMSREMRRTKTNESKYRHKVSRFPAPL